MSKSMFLVLFLSLQVFILNQRNQKILSKDQWVKYLIELANRQTEYSNVYPYNVLYYDGAIWYADCVNLQKALFNGRNIYDYSPGGYQHDLSNTGDITTEQMIRACSDVSSDFTRLKSGEPRILHLQGHIGAYLGKTVVTSEGLCNVVEATGSFGHKIAFSWVDSDGTRRNAKGGYTNGKWTEHGLPSNWVSY